MTRMVALLLVAFAVPCVADDGISRTVDITLCDLPVPEHLKDANFSSSVIYAFRLTAAGTPCEVRQVRDDFVGKRPVEECLSDWLLSGLPASDEYIATFSWKHGAGWVKVAVVGGGSRFIINIPTHWRPYKHNAPEE